MNEKPKLTKQDEVIKNYVKSIERTINYVFPVGEMPHPRIEQMLGGIKKNYNIKIDITPEYKIEKMMPLVEDKKVYISSIQPTLIRFSDALKYSTLSHKIVRFIIRRDSFSMLDAVYFIEFLMKKTISLEDIQELYHLENAEDLVEGYVDLWNKHFSKSKQVKLFKFLSLAFENDLDEHMPTTTLIEKAKTAIQEYTSLVRETMLNFQINEQPELNIVLSVDKLDFFSMSEEVSFVSCFRVGGEYNGAGPLCMQNPHTLIAYEPDTEFIQELKPFQVPKKKQRVLIVFNEDYTAFWIGESKPGRNPRFTEAVEKICAELIGLEHTNYTYYPRDLDAEMDFSNRIYLDMDLDITSDEDDYESDKDFSSSHIVYPIGRKFNRFFHLRFNPEIPHLLL